MLRNINVEKQKWLAQLAKFNCDGLWLHGPLANSGHAAQYVYMSILYIFNIQLLSHTRHYFYVSRGYGTFIEPYDN